MHQCLRSLWQPFWNLPAYPLHHLIPSALILSAFFRLQSVPDRHQIRLLQNSRLQLILTAAYQALSSALLTYQ